jgi:hypothetical protein
MDNPIKNNRIVSNYSFAVRLKSFIEDVQVNDACAEEEKEAMLNTANELLNYQIETATHKEEIAYLENLNLYPKKPIIKTHDGMSIYSDNIILFSCMKHPSNHDQIISFVSGKLKDRIINKNRLFFAVKYECENYIKSNRKTYSIEDIKDVLKIKQKNII